MTLGSITRCAPMLAVVTLLPSAFAGSVSVEQLQAQKEGVELIRQVEEAARDVRYNAGRLNSFTNSLLNSKWTHVHHLDQIRALVNEGLRPALARLVEIRPLLPEWKQQSIDQMIEAAKMLASDTDSAILAKRTAGALPPAMNTEYKAWIARVYEHAETLVKTSDAAGTYAAARLKAMEAGVKVPAT